MPNIHSVSGKPVSKTEDWSQVFPGRQSDTGVLSVTTAKDRWIWGLWQNDEEWVKLKSRTGLAWPNSVTQLCHFWFHIKTSISSYSSTSSLPHITHRLVKHLSTLLGSSLGKSSPCCHAPFLVFCEQGLCSSISALFPCHEVTLFLDHTIISSRFSTAVPFLSLWQI